MRFRGTLLNRYWTQTGLRSSEGGAVFGRSPKIYHDLTFTYCGRNCYGRFPIAPSRNSDWPIRIPVTSRLGQLSIYPGEHDFTSANTTLSNASKVLSAFGAT